MSMVFLYREKSADDRDCCAYIDVTAPKFECGHYFGGLGIDGACYSCSLTADYDEVETVLTREEFDTLKVAAERINELGYGITEGDARYKVGLEIKRDIAPIMEKLQSDEARKFQDRIIESEMEFLKEEYGLDDNDIEDIFDEYYLDYKDRGCVSCVFNDTEECGYEEAWSLGYISPNDSISSRYFDYAKFGEDLVSDDERYLKLNDGRVVCLNY